MKTIKNDFAYSSEGVESFSAEVTLDQSFLDKIEKAQKFLKENKEFSSINIDAWTLDIKQFDSTLDDEDIKEIPYDNSSYFRSDAPSVIVYGSGASVLRAFGKWDCSQYYEMYLSE
jgi:hypothetical protein